MKKVKCPCGYIADGWVTFREHVEDKHIDVYYQYIAWFDRNSDKIEVL